MYALQEVAVSGDLAAAQAATKQQKAQPPSDCSTTSSTARPDSLDPAVGHQDDSTSATLGQQGDRWGSTRPRTPMSPQPDRPPRPALTRQLSKSAPASPKAFPNVSFQTPKGSGSAAKSGNDQSTGHESAVRGSIHIPGRSLGGESGTEGVGSVDGGSERGLEGVSPPDGYMADSEHNSWRHRLHHSSVSFNDSGETNAQKLTMS